MVSKSPEELFTLALRGVEKWNAWAEECEQLPDDMRPALIFQGDLPLENWAGFIFPSTVFFKDCKFIEKANFIGSVFKATASFEKAEFCKTVDFGGAKFAAPANFNHVHFKGRANFRDTKFDGDANFYDATFCKTVSFEFSTFHGRAEFGGKCKFVGLVLFSNCWFGETAWFNDATFCATTVFDASVFSRPPFFHNTNFHEDTRFGEISEFNFPNAADSVAEDNFRALKLYMLTKQEQVKGVFFLKIEMESIKLKRKGIDRVLLDIYKLASNYGTSLSRPFDVWMVAWIIFSGGSLLLNESGLTA
jgi:hypothetical protein